MFSVSKRFWYFDESDKEKFNEMLEKENLTKTDFANKCGISLTLLTLLMNGKRSITKEVAEELTKNGFKVKLGD